MNPGFFDPSGWDTDVSVDREYSYRGEGTIDLQMCLHHSDGREALILIEVKVHDYSSARRDQIRTYLEAAQTDKEGRNCTVYFIYFTQFNERRLAGRTDVNTPGTLEEFTRARQSFLERVAHFSWLDFYDLLDESAHLEVSKTLRHILRLQRSWMETKCEKDLQEHPASVFLNRRLEEYFPTTPSRLDELKALGSQDVKGEELTIDLEKLDPGKLKDLEDIIRHYGDSKDVKKVRVQTQPETIAAAKDLFSELAQEEKLWLLLGFYARVFEYAHQGFVELGGTGTRGFAIRLLTSKGRISLCTLQRNRRVVFKLRR